MVQKYKMREIGIVAVPIFLTFFILFIAEALNVTAASTIVVNGTCVEGNIYCDTIQEAVGMANEGDIIIVCPGTYTENIKLSKSLNLQSYAGASDTTVEAYTTSKAVFYVTVSYVNISGFTIKDGGPGISLDNANYCNISNNNIIYCSKYYVGIWLNQSCYNIIKSNIIKSNLAGIAFTESDDNVIEGNIISNSSALGIWSSFSYNNIIKNNIINSSGDYGIQFLNCYSNIIEENNILDNVGRGFLLFTSDNNIIRRNSIKLNYIGIVLEYSNNNSVLNNVAFRNKNHGIHLWKSTNNIITNNTAYENGNRGINLESSSGNEVSNNIVNKNSDGIKLKRSNNNKIGNNTASENE